MTYTREVFEARQASEARRSAQRPRGDDSDNSTVGNNDGEANRNDGGNINPIGQGNVDLEGEEAKEEMIKDTIEATIRHSTTSMFRHVLMFSDGVANLSRDLKKRYS